MKKGGFSTRQIHGEGHDNPSNAHVFPIFQTSTFVFDSPENGADLFAGRAEGYIYSRMGNPTVDRAEKVLAGLEGAAGAVATSSGMAAVAACVFPFCKGGDHIAVSDTLYGASTTLLTQTADKFGVESTVVSGTVPADFAAAVRPQTQVVFIETPANPTLAVLDIAAIADAVHDRGALLAVDNTFATPYYQNPLELGADLIMHSATKYLGGHGDVIMGFAAAKTDELAQKVRAWVRLTGGNGNPFEAFLCLRGMKTLSLRMERHTQNAQYVAEYLRLHPKVERVYYPGLPDHPNRDVVQKQMRGCSGVMAFDLKGGYAAGSNLLKKFEYISLAVSLGTIDSLIQHPASMTHSGVSPADRLAAGIGEGLIRLSVGIEDVDDLIGDLDQALAQI